MKAFLRSQRTVVAAVAASALSITLFAAPASAELDEGVSEIDGVETNLDFDSKQEFDDFIQSDAPKTVTVDASTGEIAKVEKGEVDVVQPLASVRNDLCVSVLRAAYCGYLR